MTSTSHAAVDSGLLFRPAPPASTGRSCEELALDAQRGEIGAFEELVTHLHRPLYHFLCLRTGNAAEAEELCQDAFLRAWQKLDRYDPRWRFTTWLFTLAKRLAASRARVRRPEVLPDEAQAGLADDADPATLAAEREERSLVWSLAGRCLSVEQRSALWLRYGEDLSIEEIARILDKRRVTVRVLLFRAREVLARAVRSAPEPLVTGPTGAGS